MDRPTVSHEPTRTHRSLDAESADARRAGRPQSDWGLEPDPSPTPGLDPRRLDGPDLLRELDRLYATRLTTLRHGSDDAVDAHSTRTRELEAEYRRRFPQREVDPRRLRPG